MIARTKGGVSLQQKISDAGNCADPTQTRASLYGQAAWSHEGTLRYIEDVVEYNVKLYGEENVYISSMADNLNWTCPGSTDGVSTANIVTINFVICVRGHSVQLPAEWKLELPPLGGEVEEGTLYAPVKQRVAPEAGGSDGLAPFDLPQTKSNPDILSKEERDEVLAAIKPDADKFKQEVVSDLAAWAVCNDITRGRLEQPTDLKDFLQHTHARGGLQMDVIIEAPPISEDATTPEAISKIVQRVEQVLDRTGLPSMIVVVDGGE